MTLDHLLNMLMKTSNWLGISIDFFRASERKAAGIRNRQIQKRIIKATEKGVGSHGNQPKTSFLEHTQI